VALRLIVTRPAAQAADWVRQLTALGLEARALPLLGIEPVDDPAPLKAAWHTLPSCKLVVFVSPNAVLHFFAAAPAAAWPRAVLAGSTGQGTTQALRQAGVPAAQIVEPASEAGQFDTEALWSRLQAMRWTAERVQVVRGENGRDWLADVLRGHGAEVDFIAAYRRTPPRLDGAGRALLADACSQPAQHLWLFSSSEAVACLRALAPAVDWSRSRGLASHPRIAQAVRDLGFGQLQITAPTVLAVAQAARAWDADGPGAEGSGEPGPSIQ
jgi:uroporphyrinogen-III synthase